MIMFDKVFTKTNHVTLNFGRLACTQVKLAIGDGGWANWMELVIE